MDESQQHNADRKKQSHKTRCNMIQLYEVQKHAKQNNLLLRDIFTCSKMREQSKIQESDYLWRQ